MALALAAGMLVASAGTALASHDFSDVPTNHAFHAEISWLVDEGITTGYPDGVFKPAEPVTRQAAAAFLYRQAGEPDGEFTNDFSDVSATHPFYDEISWAAERGITDGYDDGTFKPTSAVSRQAAMAFIFRGVGEPDGTWASTFPDVPPTHTFYEAISWGDGEDITNGYDDGEFKPTNVVTRQAMAAFLYRTDQAGYTISSDNQTFTVTPADDATLLQDGDRAYEASDFGDTTEVTLNLADAANVTLGGTVEFTADGADFGDNDATIDDVKVIDDDVTHYPINGKGDSVMVDSDSVVSFVVRGDDGTPESVVPTVYADENNNDELDIDGDEVPTEAFGIGGTTVFKDESVTTSMTISPMDEVNPAGTTHTTTVTVTDQFGDGVDGEDVEFTVERDGSTLILTETTTTDGDGEASLSYAGPASVDVGTKVVDTISADTSDISGQPDATTNKHWSAGVVTNQDTGDRFSSHTFAIDAAQPEHTLVAEGEFAEEVTVDKQLTLQSNDASLEGAFQVDADNVTIDGYTITVGATVYGSSGIGAIGIGDTADDVTISNNVIEELTDSNARGILTPASSESNGGTIVGNTIRDARTGVYLDGTHAFDVSGNTISGTVSGIAAVLDSGSDVVITGNTFTDNDEGVGLAGSGVSISGNTFELNDPDYSEVYIKDYTGDSIYTPGYLNGMLGANTFTPAAERDDTAIVPIAVS